MLGTTIRSIPSCSRSSTATVTRTPTISVRAWASTGPLGVASSVCMAAYGIYYDRVTLEIVSLERGLDGRALPIDVRLGSANYLDSNGHFVPGAPTFSDPFTGFIIPGAGGASEGINIIDN